MSRWLQVLLVMIFLAAAAAPAGAQMPAPPPPGPPGVTLPSPAPPGVAPAWAVVPTSPRVLYAQNIPGDLFRLHNRYYYYSNGAWYRGKHLHGPWRPVRKLPKAIYRVDRSFFKTPPPW
jgi:hypothetical protein